MLLSSILRILDQNPQHLNDAAPQNVKAPAASEAEGSSLQKIELELAAAADLVKPSETPHQPAGASPAGPFLEELLRAITKFEKPEDSRVVDFFE